MKDNSANIANLIHSELTRRVEHGFSGSIIIEHDKTVILAEGYGWANREKRLPFTTSTIAQIGSLTKQFTAAVLVDLMLSKQLNFSDNLSTYFKKIPAQAASVTLHQLLTHTSGLPESVGDDFDLITPKELLMQSLSRRKYPWQNNFSYELISKFHLGKP